MPLRTFCKIRKNKYIYKTHKVKCGWKIEYCAAAENSTYCPDDFDEFFKDRLLNHLLSESDTNRNIHGALIIHTHTNLILDDQ